MSMSDEAVALALEYLRKHGEVNLRSRREREQVLTAARAAHWNGVQRTWRKGLRLASW